jgi:hypothetical protein
MGFFDRSFLGRIFEAFDPPTDRGRTQDERRMSADVASAAIAIEGLHRAFRGDHEDHEDAVQLARARWMAEHRAIESFGCGIAVIPEPSTPDPWHERFEPVVPVTVMVIAEGFVFLREGIEGVDLDPLVEVGRFPRDAFLDVRVATPDGRTLPEPTAETFEPSAPCRLVVRWTGLEGQPDEDDFAFRSTWVATQAARRFRRAAGGPEPA